jgi:hypothetical protein
MLAYLFLYPGDVAKIIVGGGFLILALFLFFLWIAMLIDAIKHSKDEGGSLRLLLLFLFGSVYGILYYFTVYRKRKESDTSSDYPVPQ